MQRILIIFLFFVAALACGCNKNSGSSEEILYGLWTKGSNTGDTLWFGRKNGKNIMSFNLSFNPALYAPFESEYIYRKGKLSVKLYGPSNDFSTIDSFKWKQTGIEFEVRGIELFLFMSSSGTYFTYHKIQ